MAHEQKNTKPNGKYAAHISVSMRDGDLCATVTCMRDAQERHPHTHTHRTQHQRGRRRLYGSLWSFSRVQLNNKKRVRVSVTLKRTRCQPAQTVHTHFRHILFLHPSLSSHCLAADMFNECSVFMSPSVVVLPQTYIYILKYTAYICNACFCVCSHRYTLCAR